MLISIYQGEALDAIYHEKVMIINNRSIVKTNENVEVSI